MIYEWNKCNFCKHETSGKCIVPCCISHNRFRVDRDKIRNKALECQLSIADILALVYLEDIDKWLNTN